jgi:hypothetical protein
LAVAGTWAILVFVLVFTSGSLQSGAEKRLQPEKTNVASELVSCQFETIWGEKKRLALWEQNVPDPSNVFFADRALTVTETTADGKNPRVTWFAFESKPHDYMNWEDWFWDVVYHPEEKQAYVVKVGSNRRRAKATFSVYAVNLTETIDPKKLQLDPATFAQAGKPVGAKPLSEITRDIPAAKESTYRSGAAGIYISVKAVCTSDELLLIASPSDESRPLLLMFNLRTHKWREALAPAAGRERVNAENAPEDCP